MEKIRRVVFIEPQSPGIHIYKGMPIPRLGNILLATILKGLGYDVLVYVEDIEIPDYTNLFQWADLACISTITPTADRAYQLADDFRFHNIPVVIGGVHPSFLPDEALDHAPFVIRGEGEKSLPELISRLNSGEKEKLKKIKGLSFKLDGIKAHNPPQTLNLHLDSLPMPDFSLVQGWNGQKISGIQTAKGCPFDCKFCTVKVIDGRIMRFKSLDRVMAELRMLKKLKSQYIFFYDDNFVINDKHVKPILRSMIKENLGLKWTAQVSTQKTKDQELLDLMKESGCFAVYMGFESVNKKTLSDWKKKQTVDDIKRSIREFKKRGIKVHGMFVLGGDNDIPETIHDTANFAIENRINTVQFLILTPLPGSETREEMEKENRIFSKTWSLYDAHHAVFQPKNMTPWQLQNEAMRATSKFYSLKRVLGHLVRGNFWEAKITFYGKLLCQKWWKQDRLYLEKLKTMSGD